MFPYWVLFSVFAAGAIQYRPDPFRRVQGGPIFLLMAFLMMIMVGLRFEVGGDWQHYIDIFHMVRYVGIFASLSNSDPAYSLVNLIADELGFDIWAVNLVCGAVFAWGLVRFARRQPNPWLVIMIAVPYLIIVVAMGYTRQAVAIGIILAALTQLDKGLVRFSIYMLVAASFHKSAVVVLPLVALSTPQRRVITPLIMSASAVLMFYLFIQSSYDRLVTNYVEATYSAQGAGIRVAMNIPPALIFLSFSSRFNLSEQERKLWRNFSLAAIVALALLFFTSATVALDRLGLYLIPLQMFVLGRLPYAFPAKGQQNIPLVFAIMVYSASIQFVWLNYAFNSQYWIPYGVYGSASSREYES